MIISRKILETSNIESNEGLDYSEPYVECFESSQQILDVYLARVQPKVAARTKFDRDTYLSFRYILKQRLQLLVWLRSLNLRDDFLDWNKIEFLQDNTRAN